jgi:N-acetylglucosaminyldiphosphoundecaprenol N-acetyl-beta-D-mannosaminyltransferase
MDEANVHRLLGIKVNDLTDAELRAELISMMSGAKPNIVVTPNPEFILSAMGDPEFRAILEKAELSLPDGAGLRFASAALEDGPILRSRHPGVATLELLAELCALEGKRLLLLGGSGKDPDIVGRAFKQKFPLLDVVALDPGIVDDVTPRLSEAILARLISLEPVVVAVALGQGRGRRQGKQEKVMAVIKDRLPTARIFIGVGGSIHTLSHPQLIPPASWRKHGVEWLWRLLRQPWRWQRIGRAVVVFPLVVAWEAIMHRRFLVAVRRVTRELLGKTEN